MVFRGLGVATLGGFPAGIRAPVLFAHRIDDLSQVLTGRSRKMATSQAVWLTTFNRMEPVLRYRYPQKRPPQPGGQHQHDIAAAYVYEGVDGRGPE